MRERRVARVPETRPVPADANSVFQKGRHFTGTMTRALRFNKLHNTLDPRCTAGLTTDQLRPRAPAKTSTTRPHGEEKTEVRRSTFETSVRRKAFLFSDGTIKDYEKTASTARSRVEALEVAHPRERSTECCSGARTRTRAGYRSNSNRMGRATRSSGVVESILPRIARKHSSERLPRVEVRGFNPSDADAE